MREQLEDIERLLEAPPAVLVVEDDPADRYMLMHRWKETGFDMVECATAEEALPKVRERYFDLALVNLKLPGMSGIEFINIAQKIQPHLPFVIVTGYDQISTSGLAVVHVFHKPFTAANRDRLLMDLGLLVHDDTSPYLEGPVPNGAFA